MKDFLIPLIPYHIAAIHLGTPKGTIDLRRWGNEIFWDELSWYYNPDGMFNGPNYILGKGVDTIPEDLQILIKEKYKNGL